MSNPETLVEDVFFEPPSFEGYLTEDELDLRFVDAPTPAARLGSDLSVQFYGEIILETGNFNSEETLSLIQVGTDDVVSFRTGTGPGDEVARIAADGSFETKGSVTGIGSSLPFYVSETTRWGRLYLDATSSMRTLRAESSATTGDIQDVDLTASKVHISARDEDADSNIRWGTLKFNTTEDAKRAMRIETLGLDGRSLTLEARNLVLKTGATSGLAFRVTDSTGLENWFNVTYNGGVRLYGNALSMDENVDLSALGGGNMAPVPSANSTAGVVLIHYLVVTRKESTGSQTFPIDVDDNVAVISVTIEKTNGAGDGSDAIQIRDADGHNITDSMSLAVAEGTVVRPTVLWDEHNRISAGTDQLNVYTYEDHDGDADGDRSCNVCIVCMRIATV